MKICDRCFYRDGSAVMAVDVITLNMADEKMDVCESCKTEAVDFIKNPPKDKRKYKKKEE